MLIFFAKMIKERRTLIDSMVKKCNEGSEAKTKLGIEQYQRLSGKRLDFLDILLLTRVIVTRAALHTCA